MSMAEDDYVIFIEYFGLEPVGKWVKSVNWEAHGPDSVYPTGSVEPTENVNEALGFQTLEEIIKFVKTQPNICPLRPDGKPNMPLLAFTISIEARGKSRERNDS